jgi:hypothetical protein
MVAIRLCLIALALLVLTSPAGATLRIVPDQYPTIQSAINAAAHGDSVMVRAGTYVESLALSLKDLKIFGESGAEATVITTNHSARVMDIGAGVSLATILSDLTFHDGLATEGAGIRLKESASPTIRRCRFTANRSFVEFSGSRGGGMIVGSESHPVIEDCLFRENVADYVCCDPPGQGSGGAISVSSGAQPRILRTTFEINGAAGFEGGFGGAIHVSGSAFAFIEGCTFRDNGGNGGGVGSTGSITIKECTFTGNSGYSGAAVGTNGGTCLVEKSLFYDNAPWGEGGTITVSGSGEIRNNTIAFNGLQNSPSVGGITAYSGIALRNNIVAHNMGVGVFCELQSSSAITCNDVWDNLGGNYFSQCDRNGINDNFSLDPLFCNANARDLSLYLGSPCASWRTPCGLVGALGIGCGVDGVNDGAVATAEPRLLPPVPNPARAPATLRFELPTPAPIHLTIYDATGRQVAVLADRAFEAGRQAIVWPARDAEGRALPSGVYFLELASKGWRHVQRIVLIR